MENSDNYNIEKKSADRCNSAQIKHTTDDQGRTLTRHSHHEQKKEKKSSKK
jgi:hypothetical protein